MLAETFRRVFPSVVAFRGYPKGDGPNGEGHIFATGFVVHESGIVATNSHVVQAFQDYPSGDRGVQVMLFVFEGGSLRVSFVGIRDPRYAPQPEFDPIPQGGAPWYGREAPDIALLRLNITDVPSLEIAENSSLPVGTQIATAGFPLGNVGQDSLRKRTQFMPFLRAGIVGSVFPWLDVPQPQGFTIDIMQQGGSSGSPVFLQDRPVVVGMMSSSLLDQRVLSGDGGELILTENTNISICEPAWIISQAVKLYQSECPPPSSVKTLSQHLRDTPTLRIGPGEDFSRK